MPGLNKNRKRNQTICFRASVEERRCIESRIIASGLPKGEYYRQSLMHQRIEINIGKYESDMLALAMRKLHRQINEAKDLSDVEELKELIQKSNALWNELIRILSEQKQ